MVIAWEKCSCKIVIIELYLGAIRKIYPLVYSEIWLHLPWWHWLAERRGRGISKNKMNDTIYLGQSGQFSIHPFRREMSRGTPFFLFHQLVPILDSRPDVMPPMFLPCSSSQLVQLGQTKQGLVASWFSWMKLWIGSVMRAGGVMSSARLGCWWVDYA